MKNENPYLVSGIGGNAGNTLHSEKSKGERKREKVKIRNG